jgi:hypothetical protein
VEEQSELQSRILTTLARYASLPTDVLRHFALYDCAPPQFASPRAQAAFRTAWHPRQPEFSEAVGELLKRGAITAPSEFGPVFRLAPPNEPASKPSRPGWSKRRRSLRSDSAA